MNITERNRACVKQPNEQAYRVAAKQLGITVRQYKAAIKGANRIGVGTKQYRTLSANKTPINENDPTTETEAKQAVIRAIMDWVGGDSEDAYRAAVEFRRLKKFMYYKRPALGLPNTKSFANNPFTAPIATHQTSKNAPIDTSKLPEEFKSLL